MYKILGSDGREYDSIPADKIKRWILEERVEKNTPVMPDGAEDWVFLGTLPEFAETFASQQKPGTMVPVKKRGRMAVYLGLFLLAATAGIIVFILKNAKHH